MNDYSALIEQLDKLNEEHGILHISVSVEVCGGDAYLIECPITREAVVH